MNEQGWQVLCVLRVPHASRETQSQRKGENRGNKPPYPRSQKIHPALPGKGCGGCPLLVGAAKEGRNIATGSRERGPGAASSREGLGFDGGKRFLMAKRVKMGKGLPGGGGMQNAIASALGREKWANPRRAGLNLCLGEPLHIVGNKTQQHPASQTFHPEASPNTSARGIAIGTVKTVCPVVGPAVPSSAHNSGRGGMSLTRAPTVMLGPVFQCPLVPVPLLPPPLLARFRNSECIPLCPG